jgi:hypothetical protein
VMERMRLLWRRSCRFLGSDERLLGQDEGKVEADCWLLPSDTYLQASI